MPKGRPPYLEKMERLLGEIESIKTISNLALAKAVDALIEVKAMKESTHKVQFVDPYAEDFPSDDKMPGTEEVVTPVNGESKDSEDDLMEKLAEHFDLD